MLSAVPHLLVLSLAIRTVRSATAEEWRSRSIYQVMTDRFGFANGSTEVPCDLEAGWYCGGTWSGIQRNLDYIENMGFNAIWISPITYQLQGNTADETSYHGYWQHDMYKLNEHFGTEAELKALVDAMHARDMYLMLDVVVNHFGMHGSPANGSEPDYSAYVPFNDAKYFHEYCEIDYENSTSLEVCWLGDDAVSDPDLKTEDPVVAGMLYEWIAEVVSNYSVDGLRVDSAINVNPSFFPNFTEAAGVFAIGEVDDGAVSTTCPWQDYIGSVLNYPIYYVLQRAFVADTGSISDLVDEINAVKGNCSDPTVLGSFSENHDVDRFPYYTEDMSLAKNIIAYTILADGIPIIYEGQEQHYNGGASPLNREAVWPSGYNTTSPLYSHITTLNAIRTHAIYVARNYTTYRNFPIYSDANTIAMRKGYTGSQVITILSNLNSTGVTYNLTVPDTGYIGGTQVTEIFSCSNLSVASDGSVTVPMGEGLPKVLYPTALLAGAKVCGYWDSTGDSTGTTTGTATGSATSATATSTSTSTSGAGILCTDGFCSWAGILLGFGTSFLGAI